MGRTSVTDGPGGDGREPTDHNQTSVKLAAGAAFAFVQPGPPSVALFAPKADAEAFKEDCLTDASGFSPLHYWPRV